MQIENISTKLSEIKADLKNKNISSEVRVIFDVLFLIIEILLASRLKNSRNSSGAPSQDPNRVKKAKQKSIRPKAGKKAI